MDESEVSRKTSSLLERRIQDFLAVPKTREEPGMRMHQYASVRMHTHTYLLAATTRA